MERAVIMYYLTIYNDLTGHSLGLIVYDLEQAEQECVLYSWQAAQDYTFSVCEM